MANIYTIGKSALMSANYAMSVTGHNISNADTEGYNRQVVLQSAAWAQRHGFGFVGSGVQLDDVRRVYDQFLTKQYNDTTSELSYLSTYYNQIQKINNKLADDTAGVSSSLQSFFSAVQEIASSPTSATTREAMLSESEILVGRYNNLAAQLNEMRTNINNQMVNTVELINTYANEIAKLNDLIGKAQVSLSDPSPNDLLDQRDLLINQLSQYIGVRTVENGNSLDVYIGNGQPLVINTTPFSMYAQPSAADPSKMEIGYINNGRQVAIPDKLLSGGQLAAFIEYRDKTIDLVQNELGRIAINLAWDFNEQHKLGMDLNGDMGTDFFGFSSSTFSMNASGSAEFHAAVSDPKALLSSNYLIEFDGSNYKVTRQSDGVEVHNGAFPVTIDGIDFSMTGTAVAGDRVVLKPLNDVAASLSVLLTDTNKIAAASPIRTGTGASNLGTGTISLGDVTGSGFATSGTLTFDGTTSPPSFTADVPMWVTTPDGTSTYYAAGAPVDYVEGSKYDLGEVTFTITGNPEDGDTFFIEPNTGGTGDNRNMLALAALQDARTMLNGTTTYQGVYSQLVNRIGSKTRELEIMTSSTGNMLNEIYEEIQSQSGVNLDEEAINLMKYQQNYNAASKVIQTANEMFDAILAIF